MPLFLIVKARKEHFSCNLFFHAHCRSPQSFFSTGALWGALENLNMIAQRVLLSNTATDKNSLETKKLLSGEELALAEELIRLSRLTLVLTFKAVQDLGVADQLLTLLNQELVSEEERQWLLAATPGTCRVEAAHVL
jgi:hypothetical protein